MGFDWHHTAWTAPSLRDIGNLQRISRADPLVRADAHLVRSGAGRQPRHGAAGSPAAHPRSASETVPRRPPGRGGSSPAASAPARAPGPRVGAATRTRSRCDRRGAGRTGHRPRRCRAGVRARSSCTRPAPRASASVRRPTLTARRRCQCCAAADVCGRRQSDDGIPISRQTAAPISSAWCTESAVNVPDSATPARLAPTAAPSNRPTDRSADVRPCEACWRGVQRRAADRDEQHPEAEPDRDQRQDRDQVVERHAADPEHDQADAGARGSRAR